MRLICPNCGATYEVGPDAIPEPGRDVQCSNCAHTWFETPGASEAREQLGEVPATPAFEPEGTDSPELSQENVAPEPAAAPEPTAEPAPADAEAELEDSVTQSEDDLPEADTDPAEETSDETPDAARQSDSPSTMTPSVAEILREEAQREETRRAEDAEAQMQSQPDLGLDRPVDRDEQLAEEARRRMARLRGEAAPAIGAATTAAAGARGELLPDVDEINSSLRSDQPDETAAAAEAEAQAKKGSPFRRGFFTVIILALLALIVYLMAPRLAMMVPSLEPTLTSYVAAVDKLRLWLDLTLQGLMSGEN